MTLVKSTAEHLKKTGRGLEVIPLYIQSAYKYLGFRKGKHYRNLSKNKILKCTMNPEYWTMDEILRDRSGIDARQGYGRSEAELRMLADFPSTRKNEE